MKLLATAQKLAQALLFPEACVLCDQWVVNSDLSPLCCHCLSSLKPVGSPICEVCGIPVPGDVLGHFPICSSCRAGNAEFDRARAWGLYEGSLRRVIREFKFQGRRRLVVPLVGLLRQTLGSFEPTFEYIIPVPSHRARIRARGFDQIRVLTKKLSLDTGVAIFDGLTRIRNTKPQFGLPLRERSRNVKRAFRLKNPGVLKDRKVLILDDIITTGATVQEISRMLNSEAKPAWIGVLTVARAARRYPL